MPGIVRVSEVVRTTRMSLHSTGTGQYNDCEEDLEVFHDSSPLKVTFGIANSTRRDTRTPTDISDLTAQPNSCRPHVRRTFLIRWMISSRTLQSAEWWRCAINWPYSASRIDASAHQTAQSVK